MLCGLKVPKQPDVLLNYNWKFKKSWWVINRHDGGRSEEEVSDL